MTEGRGSTPNTTADPPSKPKLPRCLLALRPPLAKWVPKPIHRQRAPKLRRETKGDIRPYCTLKKCRGKFSRTYSPASQCPCRHQRWTPFAAPVGRSSLTDLTEPASILLTNWHQGLACPYNSPSCQEEKSQLKAGVGLVAAVAAGSSGWAKRTSWNLYCHRQTSITLSLLEL